MQSCSLILNTWTAFPLHLCDRSRTCAKSEARSNLRGRAWLQKPKWRQEGSKSKASRSRKGGPTCQQCMEEDTQGTKSNGWSSILGASVKSRDSAKVAQPVNSQVIVDVAILFRSRWVFLRYAERAIHLWIHRYFPNSLISPIIIMICWNGHPPVNSQVFWRIFDIKTSSQDMLKGPSTCEFTGISSNLWYPKVFQKLKIMRYVQVASE